MNRNDMIRFLNNYDERPLTFMEVCGTHTASISENGIPSLLSPKIRLVSGPGCPVCVTVASYIDKLCQLSAQENCCIVTFGDMLRVPGSSMALRNAKAMGGRIQMVYSPLEIISLAEKEPGTTFIFAAVGFETTTPVYAVLIESAIQKNLINIKLLTALKTMPAVIARLCEQQHNIDGFIAPGHVAVITGADAFIPLAEKYQTPFVVSGFQGDHLLAAICALVKLDHKGTVKNLYPSAVTNEGNTKAKKLVSRYFEPVDASWRGLGSIPASGMALKEPYRCFDAGSRELTQDSPAVGGCACGKIIAGLKNPNDCPLFGNACTPEHPKGACMVSNEGSCFHYYINKRG